MAWIEVHQSLFTHRKTLMLASELGVDPDTAAMKMIRLWTWSLDNAPEGDLSGMPAEVIAFGAQWGGDAEQLVAALHKVGFLDPGPALHDWWDYAGKLIEQRKKNAERMRAARAKERPPENDPSGQSLNDRATHVSSTERARAPATVPNRTVPNRTEENPTKEAVADTARAEKSTADTSSSVFSLVCQSLRVNEGDDVDGLVRDGIRAFGSLRPELEAKRCRLHYGSKWDRAPATWRIAKWIEWMKREERYHAASNVRELPPPKEQPAAELTTYPPSGVELWDRLRVEFVKDNAINRLMCRRPTDWMFEELHALSFDGTTLRMSTPWPEGHFREEWRGVIRNYCRRLQESPPEVEWVPETAEAMA